MLIAMDGNSIHILRSSFGFRARFTPALRDCATCAKIGESVEPTGPLTRRLSLMTSLK